MALKMTVSFKGLNVPNAYIRVEAFRGMKFDTAAGKSTPCEVDVSVRASATDAVLYVSNYNLADYDPAGANIYEQIYKALKALPEFSAAVDVLEQGQLI